MRHPSPLISGGCWRWRRGGYTARHTRGPEPARRTAASHRPPNRRSRPAPGNGGMPRAHAGDGARRRSSGCPRRMPFPGKQEQAAEHPRQHPDRKEEPWPAGDPALPVWRNAAARDEKVNMRMVQQILSPRVAAHMRHSLRFHQNRTVSWLMSIPRSASRSSTLRSDSGFLTLPKRWIVERPSPGSAAAVDWPRIGNASIARRAGGPSG